MITTRSIEMKMNTEEKVLEEIRRQVFIRANQRRREAELSHALQALTGLPRRELETIAADVKARCHQEERDFFSVRNQFLIVFSGLALTGFFLWATVRLFLYNF